MTQRWTMFLSIWPLAATLAGCDGTGPGLLGGASALGDAVEDALPVDQARVCRIPDDADQIADQIIRLINMERFELGSVQSDPALTQVAGDYACQMIQDDFFAHEHPVTGADVSARLSNAGYVFTVTGENLAAGYWSPTEITDGWISSSAHRQVLLDTDFSRAGIAVRYGGAHGVYCVLILADRPE
ncbi:MAG: CAP domain-containing protein [Phycisphaerales bacterium]|nr:CAP domain-containing protein [Phycisphaerales bacterium]